MSRYLYNAAYFWEVVVDSRSPSAGYPVFLEERRSGRRSFLKTIPNRRTLDDFCRTVQKDMYLSEEEFEAKYDVKLSHPVAPGEPEETSQEEPDGQEETASSAPSATDPSNPLV